jgi:prepilin-type processing-associated H-X9-DG protein
MSLPTKQSPVEIESCGTKSAGLRFGLRSLLTAVAVIAAFCGAFKAAGIAGAFAVTALLCLLAGVWAFRKTDRLIMTLALPAAFMAAILAGVFAAIASLQHSAMHSTCHARLRNLCAAVQLFETRHGSLPPAVTLDEQGQSLHSWRTLLLPHLGEDLLFSSFKLWEPWNSPFNRPFTETSVDIYRCDGNHDAPPVHTSYVAVVGPDTVWRAGQGVKLSEITDGAADTILFVEMRNSGIPWAEPRDLDLGNLPPTIKESTLLKSLSNHRQGLNVAFCDGHVETLPFTIPLDQFKALLTKSGGETIDRSRW